MVEAVGSHESGWSGSDDAYFLAVAFGLFYTYVVLLECVFGNGALVLAVGCRFVFNEIEHASLLAQRRTDASGELGEVVGRVEQAISQLPVALV